MLIPIRDHNPTHSFPLVTVAFIAANVLAYLWWGGNLISPSTEAVVHYGSIPCDVFGNCPQISQELEQAFPQRSTLLSVVTSMFMHGGILHIAFNMLFLWVFGNNVEDSMGKVRFVVFYFLCGFAATAAHFFVFSGSEVPVVGASGAISGVLGAYLVLHPHARVVSLVPLGFFFFTVNLPAWLVLGLWFVLQVLGGLAGFGYTQSGGGGTAFLAHVGGFVAGWLLVRVFVPGQAGRRRSQNPEWLR